jgi:hypothetical protein
MTRINVLSVPHACLTLSGCLENYTYCSSQHSSCFPICYRLNGLPRSVRKVPTLQGKALLSCQMRFGFTGASPSHGRWRSTSRTRSPSWPAASRVLLLPWVVRDSSGSATFDGTTCETSAPLSKGDKFTIVFPVAGNFKLVCLVHPNMTGTIHVFDDSQPLPHDQAFYDRVAQSESLDLLADEDAGAPKHHH